MCYGVHGRRWRLGLYMPAWSTQFDIDVIDVAATIREHRYIRMEQCTSQERIGINECMCYNTRPIFHHAIPRTPTGCVTWQTLRLQCCSILAPSVYLLRSRSWYSVARIAKHLKRDVAITPNRRLLGPPGRKQWDWRRLQIAKRKQAR